MEPTQSCRCFALIAVMVICVAGCTAEASRYIRFPQLANPGPAPVQRMQAVQHDPYLLNDVGPEVVGARPLGYQQGLTEMERAKLVPPRPVTMQPLPPPGTPFNAPPVVSSPMAVAPPQASVPLATSAPPIVTGSMPAAPPSYGAPSYPAAAVPTGIPSYPPPTAPIVTSPYSGAAAPRISTPSAQPRAPY